MFLQRCQPPCLGPSLLQNQSQFIWMISSQTKSKLNMRGPKHQLEPQLNETAQTSLSNIHQSASFTEILVRNPSFWGEDGDVELLKAFLLQLSGNPSRETPSLVDSSQATASHSKFMSSRPNSDSIAAILSLQVHLQFSFYRSTKQ